MIECGAYDGMNHSVGKLFEEELRWDCINIEPNPRLFKNLLKNRPKSFLNINKALSDKVETIELVVPKNVKGNEMKGSFRKIFTYDKPVFTVPAYLLDTNSFQ